MMTAGSEAVGGICRRGLILQESLVYWYMPEVTGLQRRAHGVSAEGCGACARRPVGREMERRDGYVWRVPCTFDYGWRKL